MTDDKTNDHKTILLCGPGCEDPSQYGLPFAVYGEDIDKHPDAAVWVTSSKLDSRDRRGRNHKKTPRPEKG